MNSFQEIADRTIDAAKAFYREVAARLDAAVDDVRRFAEEFAENVESALQARVDSARVGLGGRIRQ